MQQESDTTPVGGVSAPPSAKITLNSAVEARIRSLAFVDQVVPSYQSDIPVQSGSESKSFSLLSVDPSKLLLVAPTLTLTEGSTFPS